MKMILLLVGLVQFQVWAEPTDACLKTLSEKFEAESKGQRWGFVGLDTLTHENAKTLIKDALAEDEEEDREKMAALVGQKNVLFYVLAWNAPSNFGTTIIAADKNSCEVIEDLLYYSQE